MVQFKPSELAMVAEWFDSNKLTLNANKTQMLIVSRKKNLNLQGVSSYIMKQYKE